MSIIPDHELKDAIAAAYDALALAGLCETAASHIDGLSEAQAAAMGRVARAAEMAEAKITVSLEALETIQIRLRKAGAP